jgi:hypothetical protein
LITVALCFLVADWSADGGGNHCARQKPQDGIPQWKNQQTRDERNRWQAISQVWSILRDRIQNRSIV